MVAYLQTVVLAGLGAPADLLGAVTPVHTLQDIIVEDLDTELHTSGAQGEGPLDLCIVEDVRTCLHGQAHASVGGGLVLQMGGGQVR